METWVGAEVTYVWAPIAFPCRRGRHRAADAEIAIAIAVWCCVPGEDYGHGGRSCAKQEEEK